MNTTKDEYRRLHDDERAEFVEYLRGLDAADWERPSLCAGWKVRDVVGHLLYGNELRLWTLPWKLARFGFSSDRSGRHYSIARAAGQSPAQLVDDLASGDAWAGSASVFPPRLTLLDRMVHHQDVRRALDHPRDIPAERLLAVLPFVPTLGTVFGAKKRTRGLAFEATDLDWKWGGGPDVSGPAEALMMAMLGRADAVDDLGGDGLDEFAGRVTR